MKRFSIFWLALSLALAGCDREENPLSNGDPARLAPPIPALTSPANGAVDQDVPTSLSWNRAEGATTYAVQVARDEEFTDVCYSAAGLTSTAHAIPGLACGMKYWWRVYARNDAGISAWSKPRSFSTFLLNPPILDSPANRDADRPLTVTLSWKAIARASGYALQVSVDSTFAIPGRIVVDDSGLTGTSRVVDGLCRTTTYFWRVRASAGNNCSGWSASWRFQTIVACAEPSVAVGGGVYETVSIRNQCWLKRNLDVGAMIGSGSASADDAAVQKYCYDNDPANCSLHGGLYTWDEAMQYSTAPGSRGICPDGWRIPTKADIATLSMAICDTGLARYFVAVEDGGTDESGFSAHLGGYYDFGYFGEAGDVGKFWISEQDAFERAMYWVLGRTGYGLVWVRADKNAGYSVRCVRE